MTPLVEQQFESIRNNYQGASIIPQGDGSFQINLPEIILPKGWTKGSTAIKFIVPIGYPMARPDCFWADVDLRLSNGGMPINTNISPMPPNQEAYLWFSWHLSTWNPNNDNLLTYVNVIKRRLHDPR